MGDNEARKGVRGKVVTLQRGLRICNGNLQDGQ